MNTTKLLRLGLYLSCAFLLTSAVTFLWPLLSTPRFWLGAGFAVGIVGTFFFTVALSSVDTKPSLPHEEE